MSGGVEDYLRTVVIYDGIDSLTLSYRGYFHRKIQLVLITAGKLLGFPQSVDFPDRLGKLQIQTFL